MSAESNVSTPSNATMSNLAYDVVLMKEYHEKNQAIETKEKEDKKKKFTTMPPLSQSIILAAPTKDCRSAA